MHPLLDRAMRLWLEPVPDGDAGLEAFAAVYANPVPVNGVATDVQVLVDRARMLQGALADLRSEVLEQFEAPGRLAFAFRHHGRHVGPLETPLGVVAPTGRDVQVAGMDIFLTEGEGDAQRVIGIWAIADYLGLLMTLGAVEPLTTTTAR